MDLPVAFVAALGAGLIVICVVQTLNAYGTLPERVPIGLDPYGWPTSMAPRPMIWFGVAAQLVVAAVASFAGYAIATHAPNAHGSLLGAAIASVCIIALLWRMQMQLILAAKSGGNPVPMRGFWAFFAVSMAIVVLDVIVVH